MIRKIKNFFSERFDTENFFLVFRFILFLFLILVSFNLINLTLSRYASDADVNLTPKMAFFIADVGRYENGFKIDSILPSSTPYYYAFTVSNFKDDKKANVNIEYEIELRMTTNLPLNVKVFKNTSNFNGNGIITSNNIVENADGMFFREMQTETTGNLSFSNKTIDTFVLYVEFPESYKLFPELYEGVIELVEVKVLAKQVV